MTNRFAAIGLGALIALAPLATLAQTAPAAPSGSHMAAPSGSHMNQMRHRRNMSKEHARAGAHHKMSTAPAAPKP